ncbi:MAG: hypothetical protein J1F22_00145 [Lachnospiraceae bacterium]|nr:hypothetical protein [Lachnospiraceae bacterium]
MRKAGMITIAIVLLAAVVILFYRFQNSGNTQPQRKGQGALVKEHVEWKKYYM